MTALRDTETLIWRAQAVQGEILAEMQSRGVPQTFGYADVEAVVKDVVHCDRPLPVRPERELNWAWNRDRQLCFAGRLDAVSGALFEKLLSPLAKPRPRPDGERDTRPIDQRHGDAFAEANVFSSGTKQCHDGSTCHCVETRSEQRKRSK